MVKDFFYISKGCAQLRNFDLDMDREKVYWTGVREFKLTSNSPTIIQLQFNHDGLVHQLDLMQRRNKSQEDIPMPMILPR